jgi:hypothetical protein
MPPLENDENFFSGMDSSREIALHFLFFGHQYQLADGLRGIWKEKAQGTDEETAKPLKLAQAGAASAADGDEKSEKVGMMKKQQGKKVERNKKKT